MLKEMYLLCKRYLKDLVEVQGWISQSHREAYELIARSLGKVGNDAMKAANEIGRGVSNVGENMLRTQEEIKRGVDLAQRNMQPQVTIGRYLFIKPFKI
jgi:hypothetical protein